MLEGCLQQVSNNNLHISFETVLFISGSTVVSIGGLRSSHKSGIIWVLTSAWLDVSTHWSPVYWQSAGHRMKLRCCHWWRALFLTCCEPPQKPQQGCLPQQLLTTGCSGLLTTGPQQQLTTTTCCEPVVKGAHVYRNMLWVAKTCCESRNDFNSHNMFWAVVRGCCE